jgi:hypothetical protein
LLQDSAHAHARERSSFLLALYVSVYQYRETKSVKEFIDSDVRSNAARRALWLAGRIKNTGHLQVSRSGP